MDSRSLRSIRDRWLRRLLDSVCEGGKVPCFGVAEGLVHSSRFSSIHLFEAVFVCIMREPALDVQVCGLVLVSEFNVHN